jgi:hypothetical protein
MSSTSTITMTGAISVGHLTDLNWDLPRPTTLALNGYTERVWKVSYLFTAPPDSAHNSVSNGRTVRTFHWNAPPVQTVIRVRMRMRITVVSPLTSFSSPAGYPLSTIPPSAARYLRVTPMLRLYGHGRQLARRLARGRRTERGVVAAVADYVATRTYYDPARANGPFRASWVLTHHAANCRGYANAMSALLRVLGIPAQTEYGWVTASPVAVPGPGNETSFVQWSAPGTPGESHVWLNIYFPGTGWVPFDPQKEKFFIDPRHIGFFSSVDAGLRSMPAWTALRVSTQLSATGPTLSNGSSVIIPGEVGSQVTVVSQDNFHVTFRQVRDDVNDVLLFAR